MAATALRVLALLGALTAALEISEPKTGQRFPDKKGGALLNRLGVRYKGPIKVYAVGEYGDGTYVLKMSYGVGAQKMTSALAEALDKSHHDDDGIRFTREEWADFNVQGTLMMKHVVRGKDDFYRPKESMETEEATCVILDTIKQSDDKIDDDGPPAVLKHVSGRI